jgi:OmpA-OmpF porin, OOP family
MVQYLLTCAVALLLTLAIHAQPIAASGEKLIAQKENIIKESTIVKVENLGEKINSEYGELRPFISADGNVLFFIREGHPKNLKQKSVRNAQDIWYSIKNPANGVWGPALHFPEPINCTHYNAVFWISPDLTKMLLRGAFVEGDLFSNGVSMSYVGKDGNWTKPQMLLIKNWHKFERSPQYGAIMTNDGKAMLFYMTDKKGSYLNDLYVSFHQEGEYWTEPKSLGKKINLPDYNEMTPFMAADGVTLYFSSDRPGGLGDNDIWMTKRLDDTWTKWSDPINLGSPINTPDWDAFFTMDAGGEYAYMTSVDSLGYGESDIVRIKLLEREKPAPVVLVTGNVYNAKTKEPLSATLIYESLPQGKKEGEGSSNPIDGSFKFTLPYDKNYSIRASADKFFAISENLNLDSLVKQGYKEIHKDLYLAPIEIGQVFRLNNVFFDFDKFDLRSESSVELDRVVQFLKEYPTVEIEMSAHTDSKGSDEYNRTLSENRAKSVKNYILSKGIPESRIVSIGYGETKPVASNDTDDGRQMNRRVEFKILKN